MGKYLNVESLNNVGNDLCSHAHRINQTLLEDHSQGDAPEMVRENSQKPFIPSNHFRFSWNELG